MYEKQFLTFYHFLNDTTLLISEITSKTVDKKLKETYTDTELRVLLKKPDFKICSFSEYKAYISYRKPKKMSEEQREQARERMQKINSV